MYVIERGLAIYIAIGVVIIVNRAPVGRRECKRGPRPAKDRLYMWPRTRSLVRVEQRLRGRRPGEEQEDEYRRPTDDLASLCISDSPPFPPRSLPSRFRSSFWYLRLRFLPSLSFRFFHVIVDTILAIREIANEWISMIKWCSFNRTSKYISMDFIILAIWQIGNFLSILLKRAMNS